MSRRLPPLSILSPSTEGPQALSQRGGGTHGRRTSAIHFAMMVEGHFRKTNWGHFGIAIMDHFRQPLLDYSRVQMWTTLLDHDEEPLWNGTGDHFDITIRITFDIHFWEWDKSHFDKNNFLVSSSALYFSNFFFFTFWKFSVPSRVLNSKCVDLFSEQKTNNWVYWWMLLNILLSIGVKEVHMT